MSPLYALDGKLLIKAGALASSAACCCGGGACCHCVNGLYYYGATPGESESRSISVNGGAWYFVPPVGGSWYCQDILDQYGNFLTKICFTYYYHCRYINYVWDNADNRGAQSGLSEWFRFNERTTCLNTGVYSFLSNCAECEQCRDLDEGDSVEVLFSKLQDFCGGCCEGLTCADIEEVNESGVLVTPCTIGDCNPLP